MTDTAREWGRLTAWVRSDEFRELLTPMAQPEHIVQHRARVIVARIRILAAAFALLTPAWIIVDVLIFPASTWHKLAGMRIASSLCFAALALLAGKAPPGYRAGAIALSSLMAIPPLFYLGSIPLLHGFADEGLIGIALHAYSLLPLVVVAGLSLFPLALLEVVVLAGAVCLVVATGMALGPGATTSDIVKSLWLILLVVGASALSCIGQLDYMVRLVAEASHDPLTDAFTRRSGSEALELHFQIASRANLPLSVAFADIDRFKQVNDIFGHVAGDQVICHAAQALKDCLRQSDLLVRWGGEEFLMILPNTEADGFRQILERVRKSGLGTTPDGHPVSMSFGVAERRAEKSQTWQALIDKADQRMYAAKISGRNRCYIGDAPVTSSDGRTEIISAQTNSTVPELPEVDLIKSSQ